MIRLICSTARCDMQAGQLVEAHRTAAALRALVDERTEQRDAALAEAERLRAALAEAGESVQFYLNLYLEWRTK